jgi:hypothetical protein
VRFSISEYGGSMGKVKIAYYVVVKGRGYWRPHPRMGALGFQIVRCGPDGPDAWAIAAEWNKKWQAVRKHEAQPLINLDQLSRDQAEATRRYPPGSLGAAFQVYIRTPEWADRAHLTREKIWWPAWFRIRAIWGDVAPDTITFEMMSRWRAALEKKHGRGVAHKTIRVWRTFWKIMLGMKVARTADPSMGIRNRAPAPRWQRWSEGEAVRLVKAAWRQGYHGLACIIAVAWDTQFSPVDVRTLAARHRAQVGGRLVFDLQADGRAKTGRGAIGTLSARTERLVSVYLAALQVDLHPDAILFRTRSGAAYSRETLGHDFAAVRALTFPGDRRRLMDMRRSGVIEAIAGDAGPLGLSAKLANSISRSNTLHKTYAPVDIEAVRRTDSARLQGRRRIRSGNKRGDFVSTPQSGDVSTSKPDGAK